MPMASIGGSRVRGLHEMKVLVTFGKHPKTLAVVRSLGKAGHSVTVTDDMTCAMSFYSKYCDASCVTESPKESPTAFLRQIIEICRHRSIDLVIPMDDPECDLLASMDVSTCFPSVIALPPPSSYWTARDKYCALQLAQSLGVEVPKTCVISRSASLSSIRDCIELPAIIKPRIGSGSRGFFLLKNKNDLHAIEELRKVYGDLLLQEYIPSNESIGASFLCHKGGVRARFVHRRLVQFPLSGGPSILRESIRESRIEKCAMQLLEALQWQGVAMVEFRIDARTNRPVFMEINPRFWGSLPLAIASGVDFPSLLCTLFERGECAYVDSYKVGVKCANILPFGLAALMSSFWKREASRIAYSLLSADFFDVESREDLMPILGALLSMGRGLVDINMFRAVFRRSD